MINEINYTKMIQKILKSCGPLLGNELILELINKVNVTPNNARQIIYRVKKKGDILSTEPVKFMRNQVLYYLPNMNLKIKLREVLPDHSITINRIYQALVEQDGFLFWSEFLKVSAGVIDPSKSNKKLAIKIFNDLYELGIVDKIHDFYGTKIVIASENWVPNRKIGISDFYVREQNISFSKLMTKDLLEWLERINFVGWHSSHLICDDEHQNGYNGFFWDAIGYTYLWGLYRVNKDEDIYNPEEEKAGSLVVIESILHREVLRHDINGYINRIANINGPIKNKANFKIIPILFSESVEESAFKLARKKGIMVIGLNEVFGTKIVKALKTMRNIDPKNVDLEGLLTVLKESEESGQDGKFGTLKGYVFNFMIAYVFNQFQMMPKVGIKYTDPTKPEDKCECDIVAPYSEDVLIICEVKGRGTNTIIQLGDSITESDSVRKFFEKTCTIVSSCTRNTIIPVFITSSSFSKEAIEYMEKRYSKKIAYELNARNFPKYIYYDRDRLMELFGNDSKYSDLKRILREFFK